MNKLFVRNITSLNQARFCAGMGVDFISFDLSKITIEQANEIRGWLEGIEIVSENEYSEIITDFYYEKNIIQDVKNKLIVFDSELINHIEIDCSEFSDEYEELIDALEKFE